MADGWGTLMRTLDGAVRADAPASLTIEGSGTVSVYPRQRCYVTDIRDWDPVYAAPHRQVSVGPAPWEAPPAGAQPLEELQWRAAFHGACADLAQGSAITRDLVHLRSWPNLTRLPEEFVGPVTRICALLWRKPTVGSLVARVLELTPEQCGPLLQVLAMFGHAHASGGLLLRPQPEVGMPQAEAPQPQRSIASPEAGLMARLWQRLLQPVA